MTNLYTEHLVVFEPAGELFAECLRSAARKLN